MCGSLWMDGMHITSRHFAVMLFQTLTVAEVVRQLPAHHQLLQEALHCILIPET